MRVTVPVEEKIRDLRGVIWLSLNFLEEGYEVVLGETDALRRGVDLIEPDLFIRPGISVNNRIIQLCRVVKKSGGSVVVLDTEGGIAQTDDQFKQLNSSMEMLEYADVYFSWGQRQANILMNTMNFSSKDIILSGHPRFDLLHEELREIYRTEMEELSGEINDYILVCPNFAAVNHATIEPSEFDKQQVEFQSKLLDEYIALVRQLASDFSHYEIVIRPHPAEGKSTYRKRLSDLENVSVRREGSVRPWLLGADAMVHYSSTTGVESALIGTPPLSYIPIKTEPVESYLPVTVSQKATEYSAVRELLDDCTENKQKYILGSEEEEQLKYQLYNADKPVATKKIVDWATKNVQTGDVDLTDRDVTLKHRAKRIGNKYLGTGMTESVASLLLGSDFSNTRRQVPGISESEISSEIDLFTSNGIVDAFPCSIEPISELANTFILQREVDDKPL